MNGNPAGCGAFLTVFLAAATAVAGQAAPPSGDAAPYVLVLGTAQDAGLPQIGCHAACCTAARRDPARRRLVTSLLLADPRAGRRWLFDATPDLRDQVEVARGHPATRVEEGPRPPLFDGVFLTHAHLGHYTGLLQLGPEAYAAHDLPVYGTASMNALLAGQAPWRLLVERDMLRLHDLVPDQAVALAPGLTVTPLLVPHRREFTDTCAFVLRGPSRALLYLPDIDKWERWSTPVEDVLRTVDVALLDGSFFADGEIPGRSMADIPHPFIVESLERLAALPAAVRDRVYFTHLNHTNPAADPDGEAAARVRAAGMHVLAEGTRFGL